MLKNRLVAVLIVGLVMMLVVVIAQAQSDESRMEAGVQFSTLRRGTPYWYDNSSGLGGGLRFTYNFNKFLAVEGEMNYFPTSGYNQVRRLQGQYGVKTGKRFNQFGVFGKARPGFMRTSYRLSSICTPGFCTFRDSYTGFSMDVGGVVEFYPAKHITVRFDVGDTITRREPGYIGIPALTVIPPGSVVTVSPRLFSLLALPSETTHQLQLSVGFGYRF